MITWMEYPGAEDGDFYSYCGIPAFGSFHMAVEGNSGSSLLGMGLGIFFDRDISRTGLIPQSYFPKVT
jgi:hypothetical protein